MSRRLVSIVAAVAAVTTGLAIVLVPSEEAHADIDAVSIGVGGITSCAVTHGGGVQCWGDNRWGQLGDGTTDFRTSPVNITGLTSGAVAVRVGAFDACALLATGAVECWGRNDYGQLGDGTTTDSNVPVAVSGLGSGVLELTVGQRHACARLAGDVVECWGQNWFGALGDGTEVDRHTPVVVTGLSATVTDLSAGSMYTCAISSGAAQCWGSNDFGQLGDGTTGSHDTAVAVAGLTSGVTEISAGDEHTCARLDTGAVECWGRNDHGQVGDGTTVQRHSAVPVTGLDSGMSAVSAGGSFSCALTTAGAVSCWGRNMHGELGDTSTDDSSSPVPTAGLSSGETDLALGSDSACALAGDGSARCWGDNFYGGLGTGTAFRSVTPVSVVDLGPDTAAVGAGFRATCAISVSGSLSCWGANTSGQVGDGTPDDRYRPVPVSGFGSNVVAVAGGVEATCALAAAGAVWCWGGNTFGELGDATTITRHTPVEVTGLSSGVSAIAVGGQSACALLDTGAVACWGDNESGTLGDGTTTNRSSPVTVIDPGTSYSAISAGWDHTCGLTTGNAVKCWGNNSDHRLGTANSANTVLTPSSVIGLSSGVAQVSAGDYHTCALLESGPLECWGDNAESQVGLDPSVAVVVDHPVAVAGLDSDATSVSAGGESTCAVTVNSSAMCWGFNAEGQLGDGTLVDRAQPEVVSGLGTGVDAVHVEHYQACAIISGDVECWGNDEFGQLGDGGFGQSKVPVGVVGLGRGAAVPPSPPGSLVLTPADHTEDITWSAPADDGGADVYGYAVKALAADGSVSTDVVGARTKLTSGTSLHFDGLTNGTNYRFEVTPLNLAGWGRPIVSEIATPPDNTPPTTTTTTSTSTSTTSSSTTSTSTSTISTSTSLATTTTTIPLPPPPAPPTPPKSGYWLATSTGDVYSFGQVAAYGTASTSGVTHIESTPTDRGYWIVNAGGSVYAFGDARYLAGAGTLGSGERVVGLSSTRSGNGYWLFTDRGRVVERGDARFYGDMDAYTLNRPIIASVATPSGRGYYLIASDGGVFSFGDAKFHGSMGGQRLNAPVMALVPTPNNAGYWLIASDGGVFSFGARFRGSLGAIRLNEPIVAGAEYGNGYVMTARDGGVFLFSDRQFAGRADPKVLHAPIVSIAASG